MTKKIIQAISEHSLPLSDASLNKIVEAIGDAKIVMIGEASHGLYLLLAFVRTIKVLKIEH